MEVCDICEIEFKATIDNSIWEGTFCDDCLKGLSDDYYAFSPGDGPLD